ncbi:hypothetical protein JK635_01965 [Neobacillus sp. YIM B02564]|uniref:Uncharacterized protein n=1 Tax=Neobacillus paridis TaxID=2803862 RepID=A0ABS1TI59_9BACI|nr:hypothetical protein [Neobacillus paridis]MBL4951005.1 hypothetical protein [Neobacillus paridis]
MGYSKEEQETTLVYSAEDNEWIGYSCYSPHITKIVKLLGIENIDAEYEEGRESPLNIKFKMKFNQVSFRKGEKRKISEEQREKAAERMKNLHKKNKHQF